ncbi:MAG: NEAT domain-containing protein [Oscillospiraceae bacterium]|jgi:hypothetical protein|nr:NEAT domain-containing protein [Oscillospiraceae bacterium]
MQKYRTLAAALVLALAIAAPFAAAAAQEEDGVYLAETITNYLNPDTGVTDDGGSKNAALGEGMCRSVVYEKALVEIIGGKIYATVRLQLMSNMKDFRLYVQDEPKGGYTKAAPRVMQEDAGADTADYRVELPDVTSNMSWEMYVIPMGRDVKFYMNLSDSLTQGGNVDFVVSYKPAEADPPSAETPSPTLSPTAAPSPTPSPSPTQTTVPTLTPTPTLLPPPELSPTHAAPVSPGPALPEEAPAETEPPAPVSPAADDPAPEAGGDAAISPAAPSESAAPEPISAVSPDAARAPITDSADAGAGSVSVLTIILATAFVAAVIAVIILVPKFIKGRK